MLDKKNRLTILHDDNGVFVDHSAFAADMSRDDFSVELIAAEDYLYIGFEKPFNAAYFEVVTANSNSGSMALEYYDGTSWVSRDLADESLGLARSGFMFWDREDMATTTINALDAFYVRLKPSVDSSVMSIRGINIVFSDDSMLANEFEEINNVNLLAPGATSHILKHIGSRNEIVQRLRNRGYIKYDSASGYENITPWDLLDVHEIKQASAYLTLSKIFFNLSDGQDNWQIKHLEYDRKFEEMFALYTLTLDLDNDGVKDAEEKNRPNTRRWVR